jgi:hypothetical protein
MVTGIRIKKVRVRLAVTATAEKYDSMKPTLFLKRYIPYNKYIAVTVQRMLRPR